MLRINLERNDVLVSCSYCFSLKEVFRSISKMCKIEDDVLFGEKNNRTLLEYNNYRNSSLLSHAKDKTPEVPVLDAITLKRKTEEVLNILIDSSEKLNDKLQSNN